LAFLAAVLDGFTACLISVDERLFAGELVHRVTGWMRSWLRCCASAAVVSSLGAPAVVRVCSSS
jgi:hypothetical protein